MSVWATHVLPHLIEKAGRSHAILEARRRWIPRAHGEVLEIGVGSGLNLAFYDPDRVRKLTAIDPSSPLLERASARVRDARVPIELVRGSAEALPFADHSFDSIVMTYTLCSIDDPLRALAELRRVLRPDGELLFVEHGLAREESTRRWQRRLTPLWKRVAGGCHLDRDTGAMLQEAGFRSADMTVAPGDGPRWLGFTYQGTAHPASDAAKDDPR
jgi:ubiquinone/menaquinone biosynthesis C-methylase UbiE